MNGQTCFNDIETCIRYYANQSTVEPLKSELIGAVACSDSEKFGLAEKSAIHSTQH